MPILERAIAAFAHAPNGGLILTGSALAVRIDFDFCLARHERYPTNCAAKNKKANARRAVSTKICAASNRYTMPIPYT